MDQINQKQFNEFKKHCVRIMNELSVESIQSLNHLVNQSDENIMRQLNVYSCFPLRLIISQMPSDIPNYESIIMACCDCLSLIFAKSKCIKFEVFSDLYSNLYHLIDPFILASEDGESEAIKPKPQQFTEDLFLSAIKCSNQLLTTLSFDPDVLPELISPTFRPKLGHSIKVLLHHAVHQKYTKLKIESLKVLAKIILICSKIEKDGVDVLAWFLPGICLNLLKVIQSDDKLNKDVIVLVLDVLSKTIVLTCDNTIKKNQENKSANNEQLHVHRDIKWLEDTCSKLNIIFKQIINSLISHYNLIVRRSLALFAQDLLFKCSPQFINICLPTLLKVDLTLINDESEEIRTQCQQFFNQFSEKHLTLQQLEMIQNELYEYLTTLPRLIRTSTGRDKLASIDLLCGYFRCLGSDGINAMLCSSPHKQRLFHCLIDIAEFDYHGVHLLEQSLVDPTLSLSSQEEHISSHYPRKNFKFLDGTQNADRNKYQQSLESACSLIGSSGDVMILLDYMLDILRESNFNPPVIFIVNSIMNSIKCDWSSLSELIEEYLRHIEVEKQHQLMTQSNNNQIISLDEKNKEILKLCLIVEGIAVFAWICDAKYSHKYILKCLCPILECAGSSNIMISNTANIALYKMSIALKYESTSSLIASNIDYLISIICIKLKHFLDNLGILLVLQVIIKLSSKDMFYHFVEFMNEILSVIDIYHDSQALPLLQVINVFMVTISNWFPPQERIENKIDFTRESLQDKAKRVALEMKSLIENKKISDRFDMKEDDEPVDDDDDIKIEEENKPEVGCQVKIVESILERCVHLMASNESSIRLTVLEIVSQGLVILKQYEDHLLPIAHKLWSPLVDRFRDKDIIVIKRAFPCLMVMSETCRDFIRARTIKEVLPKMLSFLHGQSKLSYKKDRASAYRFSIAYQMQIDLLEGIGYLSVNLDLKDKELWDVMVAVMPYLSSYQPVSLQDATMKALNQLAILDANSLWFYLKMTYSEQELNNSKSNFLFANISFPNNSNHDNSQTIRHSSANHKSGIEFKSNVEKVLKDIDLLA